MGLEGGRDEWENYIHCFMYIIFIVGQYEQRNPSKAYNALHSITGLSEPSKLRPCRCCTCRTCGRQDPCKSKTSIQRSRWFFMLSTSFNFKKPKHGITRARMARKIMNNKNLRFRCQESMALSSKGLNSWATVTPRGLYTTIK